MNNVDRQGLLYRINEYIQYLMTTCIICICVCVYIIESDCCKPETDIML